MSGGQRRRAAQLIAHFLANSRVFQGRQRVALYVSVRMEPGTLALRLLARRRGLALYLPRIRSYRAHRMDMCRDIGSRLRPNRHGIPEPPAAGRIALRNLDVVLLPTLAFNRAGVRLGTGGGYYDRALADVARHGQGRRPLLIGIAYASSELPQLRAASHDVLLDQIVTEQGLINCHRGSST